MRAFSFAQAIAAGHEPRQYRDYVLEGEATAVLDFKMWGNSACLRCCFTELRTGNQFTLAVYNRNSGQKTDRYTPCDQRIDFSSPGIEGSVFHLVTVRGKRGGIVWESAEVLAGAIPEA
jgi:hypothetical protein